MSIIFKCHLCDQELAMEQTDSGSEIDCPSCNASLIVPQTSPPKLPALQKKSVSKNPLSILFHLAVLKLMHSRIRQLRSGKRLGMTILYPTKRTERQCYDLAFQSRLKLVRLGRFQQRWYEVPDVLPVAVLFKSGFPERIGAIGLNPIKNRVTLIGYPKELSEFEKFLGIVWSGSCK